MIGWYVHHHGGGHLARARVVAAALGEPVTGLSSLPRPADWSGDWVRLPLDTPDTLHAPDAALRDATANGALHWVPLGVPGLRDRMAAISAWIARAEPAAVVVDVSVEVALLARLHGIPVVSVVLPGCRDDAPHALGLAAATAIVAAWPPEAAGMVRGLPAGTLARITPVGAISTGLPETGPPGPATTPGRRHVVLLEGGGGDAIPLDVVAAARAETPGWTWTHLGGASGTWTDAPRDVLRGADVVVTHAGQGAIATVAAARIPAIVVPRRRPFDEQWTTAAVLDAGPWPATVLADVPRDGWGPRLDRAASRDGSAWVTWNDGGGAARFAAVIRGVAGGGPA